LEKWSIGVANFDSYILDNYLGGTVVLIESLWPHPQPFPSRGRETSRTSDCRRWCGGILPLEGELEGVYGRSHIIGVESIG